MYLVAIDRHLEHRNAMVECFVCGRGACMCQKKYSGTLTQDGTLGGMSEEEPVTRFVCDCVEEDGFR